MFISTVVYWMFLTLGLKRMEMEKIVEYELQHECKDLDGILNKEVICKAIYCTVSYAISSNNSRRYTDIEFLLDKKRNIEQMKLIKMISKNRI
jgi:hypothetical protein